MADSGSEKTEQPTSRKLKKEREKGHVPLSKDVITAVSVIASFWAIKMFGKLIYTQLFNSMEYWFKQASGNVAEGVFSTAEGDILSIFVRIATTVLVAAGPLLLISMFLSILTTGVQTRFLVSSEALKPKLDRFNPINGIKNLFSSRQLVELLKSLIKIVIIIAVIWIQLRSEITNLARLFDTDILSALVYACSVIFDVVMSVSIAFAAVAAADFMYQRWKYKKDLMMTKEEVKEEYKQTEGDPKIKGKIKQKQQQMAMARMMQEVPKADVVIRNPTHIAIAIKYDKDKDVAPRVIAKGADNVAMKIIEVASEHEVLMQENIPLAHALYDEVDIGNKTATGNFRNIYELYVHDLFLHNKLTFAIYKNLSAFLSDHPSGS